MFVKRFGYPRFGYFDLEEMHHDMERLFDALGQKLGLEGSSGVFPALNVTQTPDKFLVRAELPGMDAKELDIAAVSNKLSISGERKLAHESASYHRRERSGGKFSRTVTLPAEIDTEKVAASYRNGILSITLPKAEEAKPRMITVKSA